MLFAFAETLLIILLGQRLRHYPRSAGPQRGQECLHGEAQAGRISRAASVFLAEGGSGSFGA